jgi:hypothetical protein
MPGGGRIGCSRDLRRWFRHVPRPRPCERILRELRAQTSHSPRADGRSMPSGIERGRRQCWRDWRDGRLVDGARGDRKMVGRLPEREQWSLSAQFMGTGPTTDRDAKAEDKVRRFLVDWGPEVAPEARRRETSRFRGTMLGSACRKTQSRLVDHGDFRSRIRHGAQSARHCLGRQLFPKRYARRKRERTRSSRKASRLAAIAAPSTRRRPSAKVSGFLPWSRTSPTNCRFRS